MVVCSIFNLVFQLEKYIFYLCCERLKNLQNFILPVNHLLAIKLASLIIVFIFFKVSKGCIWQICCGNKQPPNFSEMKHYCQRLCVCSSCSAPCVFSFGLWLKGQSLFETSLLLAKGKSKITDRDLNLLLLLRCVLSYVCLHSNGQITSHDHAQINVVKIHSPLTVGGTV